MQRHEGVVFDGAEELYPGSSQLGAEDEGEKPAHREEDQRQGQILNANDFVILGWAEKPSPAQVGIVQLVGGFFSCDPLEPVIKDTDTVEKEQSPE